MDNMKALNVSAAGKAAIAKEEGFSAYPYNDQRNFCTVGNGILLHRRACTKEEMATEYDVEELDKNFYDRVHEAEKYVKHYVKDKDLNQEQFDALVSFIYNVGIGNGKNIKSG